LQPGDSFGAHPGEWDSAAMLHSNTLQGGRKAASAVNPEAISRVCKLLLHMQQKFVVPWCLCKYLLISEMQPFVAYTTKGCMG